VAPPTTARALHPLTESERTGIVLAVRSAFSRLKNLYEAIAPVFEEYGFKRPSAAVAARDLSEKIEKSIVQHCSTFKKGIGHVDLNRLGQPWEVKICKGSGLTINQSKIIRGESYIVVNYDAESNATKVWVLWDAEDGFFTARRANSNARSIALSAAAGNIEVLYHEKTASQQAAN
jgi:hypothetical protein